MPRHLTVVDDANPSPLVHWPTLEPQVLDDLQLILATMHRPSSADPELCIECRRPWPCPTRVTVTELDVGKIRNAIRHRRNPRATDGLKRAVADFDRARQRRDDSGGHRTP